MKKEIGQTLALYPTPLTLAGTMTEGKPNWALVGHVGIIGHDRILVSMAEAHFTNKGIKETGVLSVSLIDENFLPQADRAGCVSGHRTDKADFSRGMRQRTARLSRRERLYPWRARSWTPTGRRDLRALSAALMRPRRKRAY